MIIQLKHPFRWTETKNKTDKEKTPEDPKSPSPKNRGKSWESQNAPPGIASTSTLAAFHAKGHQPWSFAEGRWMAQVGHSILVKMSQIPIFESLWKKTKHTTSPPNRLCDSRYCAAVLRTFGPRLQVQKPKTQRFPFFLIFFGSLQKRSTSFVSCRKWLVLQTVFVMIYFPQASFHQAVEVGGFWSCSNFWWKKNNPVFPWRQKWSLPFQQLSAVEKNGRFGFCLQVDAMICWCKDKRVSFLKSTESANWEWNILEKCHFFWSLDEI